MYRRWHLVLAALPAVGALPGCSPASPADSAARPAAADAPVGAERPTRPNVVWLTLESLRADHVGCYGYDRDTTPTLDALAAEGTRYADAHAVTSWTLTSHATMFTGLYPSAHHVIRPKDRLGDGFVTAAEALAAAGYQTVAVVSGPYLRRAHNLQQGFGLYDDGPITPAKANASADITNPAMEASLVSFLGEQRDPNRPFLLFGYFWDPHALYIPPPPYDAMFVPPDAEPIAADKIMYSPVFKLGTHISPAQLKYQIAQYDGEIRCTDDLLGRVFALLRQLDLWENTAIIVTADHGEEFHEHGHNSHKNTLYVESLHVPLIVKWPRQTAAAVDERTVNLIDLFPTVLELAGLVPPLQSGRSLQSPPAPDRATFYELLTLWTFTRKSTGKSWQESDQWYAIRRGRYKLVNVETQSRWELYDLIADPGERHPLGGGHEEIVGELQGEMESWRQAMALLARRHQPGDEAQLSPEEERRLRDLGYVP